MSNSIWLYSDPHWDHGRIIQYCVRPFTSVEHMQQEMLSNINSIVKPDDELWCLGDFAFSEKTVPYILGQLNVKNKYLISGNHCKTHPMHKGWEKAKERYLQYGFTGVYQEVHNWHAGILLNHFPYYEESDFHRKYSQWRPKDTGAFLCHGHVHLPPEKRLGKNQLDVGVDGNNYFPISLDEVIVIRDKQNLIIKTNSQ